VKQDQRRPTCGQEVQVGGKETGGKQKNQPGFGPGWFSGVLATAAYRERTWTL